jgi:dihydrofolate synthase/folylpolyglutamate synthase
LTPLVLVDAAHNEEGARALAAALPPGARTLIVGVVSDKDARAIVAPLLFRATRVIATQPPSPRALPAGELAALIPNAEVAPDLATALGRAAGEPVLVAGSIFLVAEARRLLSGEPADPLPVQDPVGGRL